ncbi:hypothetical protein GCM10009616_36050 [Microlunatus lacustris]
MTTTIAPDTLIQIQDVNDVWHAAAIGPGVLCQRATPQQEAPAVQTVVWDYGTDGVNCQPCLSYVAALSLRSLPPRHRVEQVVA